MNHRRKKRYGRRAGSQRICAGCRDLIHRARGLRLVLSPDGELRPDLYAKLPGRGVHLCPNRNCLEKALKTNSLARTLQFPVRNVDAHQIWNSFIQACRDQILSILSVCLRSGWLATGRNKVEEACEKKRAAAIILSQDASTSLVRWIHNRIHPQGIPIIQALTNDEHALFGRGKPVAVSAVLHRGMSKRLTEEANKLKHLTESMASYLQLERSQLTAKTVHGKMPTQRAGNAQ